MTTVTTLHFTTVYDNWGILPPVGLSSVIYMTYLKNSNGYT